MKTEYNIKLRCATCGSEENFDFNEDKSYIKCALCGSEYHGGIEELKELNRGAVEQVKKEMAEKIKLEINNSLRNTLKGNKNIRIR